jgi:hypothetical protein
MVHIIFRSYLPEIFSIFKGLQTPHYRLTLNRPTIVSSSAPLRIQIYSIYISYVNAEHPQGADPPPPPPIGAGRNHLAK